VKFVPLTAAFPWLATASRVNSRVAVNQSAGTTL
jgi:hypothetical protein